MIFDYLVAILAQKAEKIQSDWAGERFPRAHKSILLITKMILHHFISTLALKFRLKFIEIKKHFKRMEILNVFQFFGKFLKHLKWLFRESTPDAKNDFLDPPKRLLVV